MLLVLVISLMLGATACLETAVSADEKMARACGKYVDATKEERTDRVLLQLRESRHWAELARNQDRAKWQPSFEALGRLVRDADDPDRADRDLEASRSASRLLVNRCLDIVEDEADRVALEEEPLIVIAREA